MRDRPDADAVLALLSAHRTVRHFEPTPVAEDDVRRAVAAAQMASTSSNAQAYSLVRVRDRARREQLVEWTGGQPQVAEAGAFFVVCADQRRHRLVGEAAGRPFVANLETFLVAVIDAALFAQNLCVAFEAQGYGICYIGGLRNRLPDVDRLLALPADVLPLFGLCVGVPSRDPGHATTTRPRLPVDGVLCEERYLDDDTLLGHVAEYDERMRAYYAERGQPGHDWSGGVSRKYAHPHREHLAGFYAAKGARLE